MGNAVSLSCFQLNPKNSNPSPAKLVFWEGTTRTVARGKRVVAGEIMFEFPDCVVCHADSFYIGRPIPALALGDELSGGHTYFVLPIERVAACGALSAASLAALGSSPKGTPINFGECPFEYVKGDNGRVSMKVSPELISRLIISNCSQEKKRMEEDEQSTFLCSTPELQKHYEQLVGSKVQVWSPKLETISEYRIRFSPCRFMGLEWKQKEPEDV
ncbi:uncharacterized protein LOC131148718 [Malania oleifera]|uniref:uncharacterized protein LOC131148718 n=1 Tax=Malania oleifera TaxID=397392 RepID=UPI0025ADA1BB|nr:uncharacterized protein LOC131148718 [Malania oleifera]